MVMNVTATVLTAAGALQVNTSLDNFQVDSLLSEQIGTKGFMMQASDSGDWYHLFSLPP